MNLRTPRPLQPFILLVLLPAIPTFAAQPATPPPAPTLKVNSRLTRVDITATDINGHPVLGLTQSNFTVKEDGHPQPIKNFEELGATKPAPAAAPPHLPPNTYTNAQPQAPTTEAVNVLLIDGVSTGSQLKMTPENVAYSRDEAVKYLHAMPAGTQVILIEMADHLRVLQGLTTDRDVLLAALHSNIYKQNARTSLGCIPGSPCHAPPAEMGCVMDAQSQVVADSLDNVSAYLAGIKGRKNLIWFTPGIPWLTDFPSYSSVPCLRDFTISLQRDYNRLAAAQVAIYPVDPGGVRVGGSNSVGHISMEDLADATGGKAYYDTNDLASAISKAVATGTHSYSLAYIPPAAKYDGQHHKISVTVDRPGITLEYRRGYTSIDPAKAPPSTPNASNQPPPPPPPPDAALYTAMAHGAAPSTQILFTVAVTPTPSTGPHDSILGQLNPTLNLKGKPLLRYDFNFDLSPDQVTLTDAPTGQRQGAIEFTVAAYTGTGEMLNVLRQTASFSLTPAQLATFYQRQIPMLLQIDLPPGPLFARAAVRDVPSDKLGSLEIPLTIH